MRTIVVAILLSAHGSRAQSPPTRLEFEVASIKPDHSNNPGGLARTPGGLTATNTDFVKLIEMAYQTVLVDISRVPDSVRSQRYEIRAKASSKLGGDQYWEMLRTLLEDRFKLTFHREVKERQIYALVLVKNGSKLFSSVDSDCPLNPNASNFCGVQAASGKMVGQRVSIARLAMELSRFVDRPVQDTTGLKGSFDFGLTWAPPLSNFSNDARINGALIPSGPSIFTALQEQLGLKLEPRKGEIEILIIDHAEPPSEN